MSINLEQVNPIFEELKQDLGKGFLATDIWSKADGKPLVEDHDYNTHPAAVELFNKTTDLVGKTLKNANYPNLGNYYMVNLDNNHLIVVLSLDTYHQFILADLSKTTMGNLMSVAIPNLLDNLKELDTTDQSKASDQEKSKKRGRLAILKDFLDSFSGGPIDERWSDRFR